MDIKIRQIIPESAGTYFIVTDSSQVQEFESEGRLRLVIGCFETGPVNVAIKFAKGDKTAFESVYGRTSRSQEKKGNFSHKTVLDALSSGPVCVLNLRKFSDTLDTAGICGLSPNTIQELEGTKVVPYRKLFNMNGFWVPREENLEELLDKENVLNFANIGQHDASIFVTKADKRFVDGLTGQGDETLADTSLEVEDYLALDFNMKVKDTFVTVHIFHKTFDNEASKDSAYGQLFAKVDNEDFSTIDSNNLAELKKNRAAGYITSVTGSLIPGLVSETGEELGIDRRLAAVYHETGIICNLNEELYDRELPEGKQFINFYGLDAYDLENNFQKKSESANSILSYMLPETAMSVKEVAKGGLITKDTGYISASELKNNPQFGTKDLTINITGDINADTSLKHTKLYKSGIEISKPNFSISFKNKFAGTTVVVMTTNNMEDVEGFADIFVDNKKVNPETKNIIRLSDGVDVKNHIYFEVPAGNIVIKHKESVTDLSILYAIKIEYKEAALDVTENVIKITAAEPLQTSEQNTAVVTFESGLRTGDLIINKDGELSEIVDMIVSDTKNEDGTTNVTVITTHGFYPGSEQGEFSTIYKIRPVIENCMLRPFLMKGCKPRKDQFLDGTASRQNEILDMMLEPSIVKGLKGLKGLRYVIDAFKSYVEPAYKHQFGQLMVSLDKGNRFVRAILNEPFTEDLMKSTNPMFRQAPNMAFDWSYVPDGGNKTYSSKLLTKFNEGAMMCFFFGPGEVVRNMPKTFAGKISNLFYNKQYQFDVVANASGYVDGISELEYIFDDTERKYCEKFRYNPIINFNGGNTIFGNKDAQKAVTAQQQIHNSELLAYIKEQLYIKSKTETFEKGTYDTYLRTEIECTDFMNSLVLVGAIEPNPVVQCDAKNNTKEIRKQKIKLVHIEYTPIDALEKIVFDLEVK